jgi:hypothetical protein
LSRSAGLGIGVFAGDGAGVCASVATAKQVHRTNEAIVKRNATL